MDALATGDLVTVKGERRDLDAIVYTVPSRTKVVVAVVNPGRGPIFRTVNPKELTERTAEGPDDAAMRLLMRRTPPSSRGSARAAGAGAKGAAGFSRGAAHRPTGR